LNKKNITILSIVLGVTAAIVVAILLMLFGKRNLPEPIASDAGYCIDHISCVSLTIGEDPCHDVNITWISPTATTGYVRIWEYDKRDEYVDIPATYEVETISVPIDSQLALAHPTTQEYTVNVFRAYVTGLKENTEYTYAACEDETHGSYHYTFKTGQSSGDFCFLVVSDTQGYTNYDYEVSAQVLKRAVSSYSYADFIVHLGDTVEDGDNLYQWQMYFNSADGILSENKVIDVCGNKDKKHTLYHYTNGGKDNRTALVSGYYSFEYCNVHFSVLNTGDGDKDIAKSQLKWLKKDLESAGSKTKIVLIHKAPVSDVNHCNDEEIVAIREQLMPIFEEYEVTAVLEGHDHAFYRSTINGTLYYMTGSSGTKQHEGSIISRDYPAEKSFITTEPTYTFVCVGNDTIEFSTYTVSSAGNETLVDQIFIPKFNY